MQRPQHSQNSSTESLGKILRMFRYLGEIPALLIPDFRNFGNSMFRIYGEFRIPEKCQENGEAKRDEKSWERVKKSWEKGETREIKMLGNGLKNAWKRVKKKKSRKRLKKFQEKRHTRE